MEKAHDSQPPRRRIQPLRALRAIRALVRDPDDTAKVFEIVDALSGQTGERLFRRFRGTEVGARVLQERRSLLARLEDHAALSQLPLGTLGRTYADFVRSERLTAAGLVDASVEGGSRTRLDPDRRLFADRLRDMHDLWHVVTGYHRDLVGEASLLAFTFAQTRNPGIGFIVAVAWLKASGSARYARRMMRNGYRRGRRAAWLPSQDWESLLAERLEDVRAVLRVGSPPQYDQVRSAGAPALAS